MATQTSRRALLKGVGSAGAGATALTAIQQPAAAGRPGRRPRKPNVIVVSIDDLGHDELGCYGNTFNETPAIDALAGQGMRFTQAYAAAPVCSPNRAALMTGLYPARTGVTDFLRGEPAPATPRCPRTSPPSPRCCARWATDPA